jgi:outer membrane protein, heavy metal efflux system
MVHEHALAARLGGDLCLRAVMVVGFGAMLVGCARFESKPLSAQEGADAFEHRSVSDPGLKAFLETNGMVSAWPRASWDLATLTLMAFYYHPDMDMARARWGTVTAGKTTAGQRPNPNLAFTPRLNSTSLGTPLTPWILGGILDIPIETMGKRRYRVAQAGLLSEAARFEVASTAWLVRSRVRKSLLDLQSARETLALVQDQAEALGRMAALVERQWEGGAVSFVEVSVARIAHQNAQLTFKDAQRQEAEARGQLAQAVGVPARALDGVQYSFTDLAVFPTNLSSSEVRLQAVLNRADVLGALAEYAASEAGLQLQVAKQYPDLHLRPGYELDQNKNKWTLGVSMDLPVLNQNQGPIAEARARREEAAAKFNAVQAKAIGEIDRAGAVYEAAVEQAVTAGNILAGLLKRSQAMGRMYEAGEVDKLVVITAQAEYLNGALARLRARLQAQQALAALENAVQSPLLMPALPARLETAARNPEPRSKPRE